MIAGDRRWSVAQRYEEEIVPFQAGDGLACNLVHIRGARRPTRGPVLLLHGAGVRSTIFRAPVETTLVDALVAAGYDVWLENWRASLDVVPNEWTLDKAAVYDHPVAVRTVAEATGHETMKAVVHCQGSSSFLMAAVAGLVPEVTTVVSNAVALHPRIPAVSEFKIRRAGPVVARFTRYLDPRWGLDPPTPFARVMTALIRITHRECQNVVCKWASFTYGFGFPTLWQHENLNDETHEWMKQEFGPVPMRFYADTARYLVKGHIVAVDGLSELPEDFVREPPDTDARIRFVTGSRNRTFLPESQRLTFEHFDAIRPGYHSFREVPGYGHLDMFMGRNASRDVFPLILEGLED
jgi:pimeloyl-ACP methyl ester carboxylesterase